MFVACLYADLAVFADADLFALGIKQMNVIQGRWFCPLSRVYAVDR